MVCRVLLQRRVVVTQNIQTPVADAGPDTTIGCFSNGVLLNGSNSSTGPNFSYTWSGPGGFFSSELVPTTFLAGTYTLTVLNIDNGCVSNDLVDVYTDT